jgi:hypothetical protein
MVVVARGRCLGESERCKASYSVDVADRGDVTGSGRDGSSAVISSGGRLLPSFPLLPLLLPLLQTGAGESVPQSGGGAGGRALGHLKHPFYRRATTMVANEW